MTIYGSVECLARYSINYDFTCLSPFSTHIILLIVIHSTILIITLYRRNNFNIFSFILSGVQLINIIILIEVVYLLIPSHDALEHLLRLVQAVPVLIFLLFVVQFLLFVVLFLLFLLFLQFVEVYLSQL